MKSPLPFYRIIIVVAGILFFSAACQKDLNFEDNGGSKPNKICINCEYLPVCDSSYYEYVDSTANGIDTNRNFVFILGDTTVNSVKYNKVTTIGFFDNGLLYNCDAQEYKLYLNLADLGIDFQSIIDSLMQGLPIPPGIIAAPSAIQANVLKAGASVGSIWKDVILKPAIPLLTLEVAMEHKMMQKGISRNVLGKNYNDVIEMESVVRLNGGTAIPSMDFVTLRIFYAKGVGIIEGRISNMGTVVQSRKLSRYQL